MATKKASETEVIIPAIEVQRATIKVVGDTPLIVHAWSDKAKQMILDKQMKKAKAKGHDVKNPVEDFIESLYWIEGKPDAYTMEAFNEAVQNGARFGFPTTALKASAVSAAYRAELIKNKVTMNGAFHIDGEFVEIHGTPHMREDMVRIAMGGTDIRFRGQFDEWYAIFTVRYNSGILSLDQLIKMFDQGGFSCGLGEWRVEKAGEYGMYHVE